MPELAEVEFFRKRWDPGLGRRVLRVELHADKRLFRGVDTALLERTLAGSTLAGSEARGKQMLFRFSRGGWLGVHLGMTGELRVEPRGFLPARHDHLVLLQREGALVFSDPRLFGRVQFHHGAQPPPWWAQLPPAVNSPEFTRERVAAFLQRRRRAPIKAVLLNQQGFPGIGNWMADEILWRLGLDPRTPAGALTGPDAQKLWHEIRHVTAVALKKIGHDWSDVPRAWLFHQRWTDQGRCPKHREPLTRATVGGRTTAWCPRCQP